jgi:hypothetical protein
MSTRMFRLTGSALALGTAALLHACALPGSPHYDSQFGSAWRTLQGQQVADPAAALRHAKALESMDPRAVREARERYVESFKSPPPTNVINIGVGGGQ